MTLDYLILLRLSELEKGMAAKSTFLTEKINEKIMTTAFSQKAITGRLRALHNKGFVKKTADPHWFMRGGYSLSYWSITEQGRQQLIICKQSA